MVLTSDNWCLFDVTVPVRRICYSGRFWTVCLPTRGCNRTEFQLCWSALPEFCQDFAQEASWSDFIHIYYVGLKTPIISHLKPKDFLLLCSKLLVSSMVPKKGFLFLDTDYILDSKSSLHILSKYFSCFSLPLVFQFLISPRQIQNLLKLVSLLAAFSQGKEQHPWRWNTSRVIKIGLV